MKKILRYIGLGIIVLFAAGLILGNIGNIYMSKKSKDFSQSLEGMIAEVNKHLPHKGFDGFDFFIMDKVLLKDNNVVWVYDFKN